MSPVFGCQKRVRLERVLSEGSGAQTACLIPDWLKSSASLTLHLAACGLTDAGLIPDLPRRSSRSRRTEMHLMARFGDPRSRRHLIRPY
jgi:hypothetical protein